jgi:hypothetical protein
VQGSDWEREDERLDDALRQTFPASDALSIYSECTRSLTACDSAQTFFHHDPGRDARGASLNQAIRASSPRGATIAGAADIQFVVLGRTIGLPHVRLDA